MSSPRSSATFASSSCTTLPSRRRSTASAAAGGRAGCAAALASTIKLRRSGRAGATDTKSGRGLPELVISRGEFPLSSAHREREQGVRASPLAPALVATLHDPRGVALTLLERDLEPVVTALG